MSRPGQEATPDERTRRRFARRQRARRRHTWRVLLVTALAVAGLGTAVWLVFFSSVLAVQRVDVEGAELLSVQEVRRTASIARDEPLVTVDLDSAERRLAALAPVRSVEVTRQWPDGVLVRVQEREAVALVDLGSRLRGLDDQGVVFRDYDEAPPGMPRVRLVGDPGREALREAAAVVGALPEDLAGRVGHVAVETVDQISLVLRDGTVVVWGSAEQSDQKAQVLLALLEGAPADRYDVSVPAHPVTSG